jgi:hypothetical protein
MTGGKAEAAAPMRADAAVVETLTAVCVAKFGRDAALDANAAALKKADPWSQGDSIEKRGRAAVAESKALAHLSSVVRACGEILTAGYIVPISEPAAGFCCAPDVHEGCPKPIWNRARTFQFSNAYWR